MNGQISDSLLVLENYSMFHKWIIISWEEQSLAAVPKKTSFRLSKGNFKSNQTFKVFTQYKRTEN